MDQSDLAAALNGHQVTDDEGQIKGESETPAEESAPSEETTVEETAPAEKPAESPDKPTQGEEDDSKIELAADETGKRYVPEARFDKVYGKLKQAERELSSLKEKAQAEAPKPQETLNQPQADRSALLETELLRSTLPQFNPDSSEYSAELDELGAEIFRANPGITKLEAARRAITTAKKLASKVNEIKQEARTVKALQSDQGLAGRVTSRAAVEPDPDKMSVDELEGYLKEKGIWQE